jgi:hypothetical protein
MIRTTLKVGEQLRSVDNLPPPERDRCYGSKSARPGRGSGEPA